ncbi:MAG: cupin domain-containing protein [Phycisphaeraceae bacterium]
MPNLLADIPHDLPEERIEVLHAGEGLRIERILSRGHASPPGFWYDQPVDEWVLVVQGAGRIRFENDDRVVEMRTGDGLFIRAHERHRVEWTDPAQTTVWLAVHLGLKRA